MKDALRADLTAAHTDLVAILNAMSDADWERRTPTADGWTIRDTVGHLASAETGNQYIARTIAEGGDPYRADFDLNRYNRRNIEKASATSGADNLAAFEAARASTLALLDSLSDDVLAREGRRTTGEPTTVAGVFRQLVNHEREHTAEIRAALD